MLFYKGLFNGGLFIGGLFGNQTISIHITVDVLQENNILVAEGKARISSIAIMVQDNDTIDATTAVLTKIINAFLQSDNAATILGAVRVQATVEIDQDGNVGVFTSAESGITVDVTQGDNTIALSVRVWDGYIGTVVLSQKLLHTMTAAERELYKTTIINSVLDEVGQEMREPYEIILLDAQMVYNDAEVISSVLHKVTLREEELPNG